MIKVLVKIIFLDGGRIADVRDGELGHSASVCKFKTIRCHAFQMIGHVTRACPIMS